MAKAFLAVMGWRAEGTTPAASRFVLIAAPHTTAWDFPFTLAFAKVFGIKIRWMGKHTLFKFPYGPIMKSLGGIPVHRDRSNNLVQRMAERIHEFEEPP